MTRELTHYGFDGVHYNGQTDTYSGTYEGLLYAWPGSVLRRLANQCGDVCPLFDDKYCADEFVLAAQRGVM